MRCIDPPVPAADAILAAALLAEPRGRARALAERQLEVLTRLAEIGMTIAEAAERWALAAADGAAEGRAAETPGGLRGDPGLVYSRVARAVRLTLMLQTRLLKDMPALGRAETLTRSAEEQAGRERAHRLAVRAIKAEHADADAVEQLADEAWERLRDEDLSEEIGARPLGEIVIRICKDLGLSPDWSAWALQAAAPGRTPDDEGPALAPWRGVVRRGPPSASPPLGSPPSGSPPSDPQPARPKVAFCGRPDSKRIHPAASARAGPWPGRSRRRARAGPETDETP